MEIDLISQQQRSRSSLHIHPNSQQNQVGDTRIFSNSFMLHSNMASKIQLNANSAFNSPTELNAKFEQNIVKVHKTSEKKSTMRQSLKQSNLDLPQELSEASTLKRSSIIDPKF